MSKSNKRSFQRLSAILTAVVLSLAMVPAALADTDETTPKITQQPDQLVLQLGTRWAGVEFELRTDAGIFPAPVVVDESGVLSMDLGGSTTYTLSCIESTVPIPDPPLNPAPSNQGEQQTADPSTQLPLQQMAPDPIPTPARQSLPIWPLVIFLMGLAAAGGGLIAIQVSKRRQQDCYDEWEDEEDEL